MLSVIKHAGKQSGKQSGKQARKRASQQPRKQGQSLKKSEPCPLGACCFWNSRERLKREGSRKRAQERGLKREGSRESSREKAQERAQEAQERELKRSEPCPVGACSFWEMLLFKVLRKILSLISGVFCVLKCLVLPFFLLFLLYK